ncbi:MAG: DEAD/DEAH box helicase family protein [Planctomycetota bacterium]|nr:DEAD/DEAH box helicase family protein [Planctomycetota bacterium]
MAASAAPSTSRTVQRAAYLVPAADFDRVGARGRLSFQGQPPPPGCGKAKTLRLFRKLPGGWYRLPRPAGVLLFGPAADDRTETGAEIDPEHAELRAGLRQYQERALEAVLAHDSGILRADCGTGKTVTALAMVCRLRRRAAVLVHNERLASQWVAAAAQHTSLRTTLVRGPSCEVAGADLAVCLVQTVCRREAGLFDTVGVVFFDETHHAPAKQMGDALEKFAARRRYGLTATMTRSDGFDEAIPLMVGPVRIDVSRRQEVRVFDHPYANPGARPDRPSEVVQAMVDDRARTAAVQAIVAECLGRGRRVMVIASRIQLLEALEVADRGDACLFGDRRDEVGVLEAAPVVLASTSLASEGIDLPSRNCLVMALPLSHPGIVEQVVGRVTRGSAAAEVHDLVDLWAPSAGAKRRGLYKRKGWV